MYTNPCIFAFVPELMRNISHQILSRRSDQGEKAFLQVLVGET